MDERIARTIRNLGSWEDLRQFEANARERNQLSNEVEVAISIRASELARKLIEEQTGLDVSKLSLAEQKIVQAVCEYVGVMRQQGKYPGRTLGQLRNRGLKDAAETAVSRAKPTQGFQTLVDADLEDLSYEQIIIDHPEEFSPRAQWFARRTLGLHNDSSTPPAFADSDTQVRTAKLILWLKLLSSENDGYIPVFSNADAAEAMGIGDAAKFGRVHGNIQSRIDLACFMLGLPPLGLAAQAPFEKAWGNEGLTWSFPVEEMQAAAQSHRWTDAEFDQVLRETEKLPGQAHISWKETIHTNSEAVKNWAYGLSACAPSEDQDLDVPAGRRNLAWSRDELILALDLYLRHRASPPGKDSAEVNELSEFLNKMSVALARPVAETYRNANGVYMKLMNFRRFDPDYTIGGKVGLTRGNKDEALVWAEFSGDISRLHNVVAAIRLAIEDSQPGALSGMDEPDIIEAEEGRVLTRLHRIRERSRSLVDQCKKNALKKHGQLACEACGFDFSIKYGNLGAGLIEVHHTKPVHTLVDGDKTKLEDLALLCANCHRVVHSSRRWLTIQQVKDAIQLAAVSG
jgi:predicted HNH restriction endonuclease